MPSNCKKCIAATPSEAGRSELKYKSDPLMLSCPDVQCMFASCASHISTSCVFAFETRCTYIATHLNL